MCMRRRVAAALGRRLVEAAGQPAGRCRRRLEPGRVPDGHRLEVRPVRIGIPDALDDRKLLPFEQLGEAAERWVQPDMVVDLVQPLSAASWSLGRCLR